VSADRIVLSLGYALLGLTLMDARIRQSKPALFLIDGMPLGHRAITIPPLGIVASKSQVSAPDVLPHELHHWKQAQEMGILAYYVNYLTQYFTQGYPTMPMEVQARQAAYDETGVVHPTYGINPAA
jgi:hypothetical protein